LDWLRVLTRGRGFANTVMSEKYSVLGCNAVQFAESSTFRMSICPPPPPVFGVKEKKSSSSRRQAKLPLVPCLAYPSICSSETSGSTRSARRYNPRECTLYNHAMRTHNPNSDEFLVAIRCWEFLEDLSD
jgi:hypothetical protein